MMKSRLRRKQVQAIAALVMAITASIMVVGLGLSTGMAGASSPTIISTQTVPLTQANGNASCSGSPTQQGGVTFGSMIITKTGSGSGSGQLIANVMLQNATPNAIYNISMIQTPSTSGCHVTVGMLTTNAQGNGNANVQVPVRAVTPSDTGVWVALNNANGFTNSFATRVVSFS